MQPRWRRRCAAEDGDSQSRRTADGHGRQGLAASRKPMVRLDPDGHGVAAAWAGDLEPGVAGMGALIAVGLALLWIWVNPRAFPPPKTIDNWMSKGVYGERIYLAHRSELAAHHRRAAAVLSWLSLPGLIIMAWGLWAFWWEGAIFGTLLAMLPKIWFVDRMVWIFEDWQGAGRALPGEQKEIGDV